VLALAPVSGLVPLRHLVADRYTLFPSLALFAALAVAAIERFPRHAVRVLAVAAVVLVPVSVLRQREWHDGRSLWEANVRLEPAVPAVRMNLAEAYGAEQRWEAARTQTLELWKLRPEDPRVLVQAVWLSGKVDGATDEVLEARQQALLGGALSADAVVSVAEDCLSANHLNSADTLLRHAPSVKSDPRALRIGSVVARRQRRAADAIALAQQALSAGDERARVELAFALVDGGRVEEALRLVEAPMPDARGQALLRGAKAYALQRAGRLDEARAENAAALEQLRALPP
jgi:Flp pilus assembly protein TadD